MTKGYGLSVDDIDWSCPKDLEPYEKAHKLETRYQDSMMHIMGIYALSAISTSIDRSFSGKKAKSEYMKEPLLSNMFENYGLTDEEIVNKEIEKAIIEERKYMAMSDLPKTIMK